MTSKFKSLIIGLFFLTIGTKAMATEWTSYFIYQATTTEGYIMPLDYLRPVTYYECLSFSLGSQSYSIMDKLREYKSVFDYEKLEVTEPSESECISVYLKAKNITNVERNELLASLLMQEFKSVRIYLKGDEQGNRYALSDINMPFFLPMDFEEVYAFDYYRELLKAASLVLSEKEMQYNLPDSTIWHEVEAGETLYGIAKKYKISQEEIIKYNPHIQDSPLQIGQKIRINLSEKNNDNQQDTLPETNEKGSTNIVIYLLFGVSVLLNGLFLWMFLKRKKWLNLILRCRRRFKD